MNSHDSFRRWKFKNPAPTSSSPGPILWPSTISFQLHREMAEEIDLEMCSYRQLSEVQMLRDLDLDIGSGQGHVNIRTVRVGYLKDFYVNMERRLMLSNF